MLAFFTTFGITPTKNFEAAGWDWYIPNIDDSNTELIEKHVIPAFCKLYNITKKQLKDIMDYMWVCIKDRYYIDIDDEPDIVENCKKIRNCYNSNRYNTLLLYLAWSFKSTFSLFDIGGNTAKFNMSVFVASNLVFDTKNNVVGVKLNTNQSLFVVSGVKQKIPEGWAGVFMNKSGRGSSGWIVKAQVVDEDYTGYVSCNAVFTGTKSSESTIYCGDKFVQQLVLPVYKGESKEVSEDEFNELTNGSKRGEAGFGSSNEKH